MALGGRDRSAIPAAVANVVIANAVKRSRDSGGLTKFTG